MPSYVVNTDSCAYRPLTQRIYFPDCFWLLLENLPIKYGAFVGKQQVCQGRELTFLTQCGMVCVLGERWWVLMTMTVMMMEAMTNTMVNSMYLPIRGTALDVEGISSTMTSRNTVKDSSTEMLRVIFSPGIKKAPKIIAAAIIQCREHLLWGAGCGWEPFTQTPVCMGNAIISASSQSSKWAG